MPRDSSKTDAKGNFDLYTCTVLSPALGVRMNAPLRPERADNTARVLFSATPTPRAINVGRERIRLFQFFRDTRWATRYRIEGAREEIRIRTQRPVKAPVPTLKGNQ